jgi:hypothetical protein
MIVVVAIAISGKWTTVKTWANAAVILQRYWKNPT